MSLLVEKIRARNLVPILVLYYTVGVAGLVFPWSRDWFTRLIPVSLLLSLGLLFLFHGRTSARFWLTSLLIFALSLVIEITGVTTGLLFGEYQYGEALGLKVFHTPLMIGMNWLMLVYCSSVVAGRWIQPLYYRSLAAGTMMVVYDIALEPAAIRLDMWEWTQGAVPLQNYIAWFVIAVALNYLAGWLRLTPSSNKLAGPLFFIQLAFFIVLDILIVAERLWV